MAILVEQQGKNSSLDNIYFLRTIHRTGISTAHFSAITLAASLILGALIVNFALNQPAVPGLDPLLLPAIISVLILMGGSFTCLALYFQRANSADMTDLVSVDAALAERVNSKGMRGHWQLAVLLLLIVTYYGAFVAVDVNLFPERTPQERWERITGTSIPVLLYFVALPVMTFGAWLFSVVILQQNVALTLIARQLPIEISQLLRYQSISNPFVRIVVVFSLLSALFPLALFKPDDVPIAAMMMVFAAIGAFIFVSTLYFLPVVLLRNRIRQLVHQEQLLVAEQMITEPDNNSLMVRQMYLESRWEWPIASNVQKIIAFGLLPPIAWVMAAIVENLLF